MSNAPRGITEQSKEAIDHATELASLQYEEARVLLLQKNVHPGDPSFPAMAIALAQVIATNFQSAVIARKGGADY